jgi:hypothetical protein
VSVARNLNSGLGIDFQAGFQDGLVSNRGADMIHEIGVACPKCRTSDTHANMLGDGELQTRSPHCKNCNGDGWLFRDPVIVRGLATSIRQQKNILDVGIAQPGDMQFSIGPGFLGCGQESRRVGRNDKFTATWSQPLDDGQTIVRAAASMAENIGLDNNVEIDEDRLWYEPDASLWCEDENGVVYGDGDFTLGPGRVIKWIGNAPRQGVKYSIKYTAYLEWLAWAPPMERVDRNNEDMGPLIFLRKRHTALINTSPFITSSDRIPLLSRVEC